MDSIGRRNSGSLGWVVLVGDNVAMESLYALLRKNVLDRKHGVTRSDLASTISFWIKHADNCRRRQRTRGKVTPVEFELEFVARVDQAA